METDHAPNGVFRARRRHDTAHIPNHYHFAVLFAVDAGVELGGGRGADARAREHELRREPFLYDNQNTGHIHSFRQHGYNCCRYLHARAAYPASPGRTLPGSAHSAQGRNA